MKNFLILTILLCVGSLHAFSAENRKGVDESEEIRFLYTPEKLDSLLADWHNKNIMTSFDSFFDNFVNIDTNETYISDIPDSVYVARLKMIISPIKLPYNDIVRKYIIAYTTKHKVTMGRIIGFSQFYFPMIEQELANANMPLELKYLAAIESALSPTAVSRMGATGLWQFVYGTGKNFGLEINSFVDQRMDPVASTKAACQYLKYLHRLFGDWTLALAAYNCGEGNVGKALKRAGGDAKTYWDIYPYLPAETRGYIPSFVAAAYAYSFHKLHNIEPCGALPTPLATDTIIVSRLMHLEQVSSTIDTPIEVLRALNPQYKIDIIPAQNKQYALTLPQHDISKFIEKEQEIYSKDSVYLKQYLKYDDVTKVKQFNVATTSTAGSTYKVKSGDTLGAIASKYKTTASQIAKWNGIKTTTTLRIGQTLKIHK